jgi:hypothetical protein
MAVTHARKWKKGERKSHLRKNDIMILKSEKQQGDGRPSGAQRSLVVLAIFSYALDRVG